MEAALIDTHLCLGRLFIIDRVAASMGTDFPISLSFDELGKYSSRSDDRSNDSVYTVDSVDVDDSDKFPFKLPFIGVETFE